MEKGRFIDELLTKNCDFWWQTVKLPLDYHSWWFNSQFYDWTSIFSEKSSILNDWISMFDGDLPQKTCWSSPHVCWLTQLTPHTGRIPVQFSHRTLRLAALGILKMGQTCFWGGNFCHVSQKNNLFFDVRYLHYTSNNPQHKHRTVLPKLPVISQVPYVGVWKMMQPGPSIATTRKLQNDQLSLFGGAEAHFHKEALERLTPWSPSRIAANLGNSCQWIGKPHI